MGTSAEKGYAENIHEIIRLACKTLEEIGYNSLVVLVSPNQYTAMGSEKGRQFIAENFHTIEKFVQYCHGDSKVKSIPGMLQSLSGTTPDVGRQTTVTSMPYMEGSEFEEDSDDVKHEFDDGDSDLDDEDMTEMIKKESPTIQGSVIPKGCVVVLENAGAKDTGNVITIKPTGEAAISTKVLEMVGTSAENSTPSREALVSPGKAAKRTDKDRQTFMCDQCDKRYVAKKDLIIHQRKHSGETPFTCDVCNKAFRSRGFLRAHQVVHSVEKRYVCDTCGLKFLRRNSLYRHRKAAHSVEVPYVCDLCGKGFRDASTLRGHVLRHAGYKPHSCEFCGASFLELRAMKIHRRIHTGEKPYPCELCGECFRIKKNLANHKRKKHVE